MVLFHDEIGHRSQKVRIILQEKEISCDLESIDAYNIPKEILDVNPDGSLPLLIDRELSLYNSALIVEYLDERFPHPPLLPVYPVARAQTRLILDRLEKDLSHHLDIIENENSSKADFNKSKNSLETNLKNSLILFGNSSFFNEDEFSILDAVVSPILFRLNFYGIKIPNSKASIGIKAYMERIFEKESFKSSLTETEREKFLI
tara:strand:+ start:1353 stop:1964 length:612 start_codon:yes stop_codon:yes gene_type:complete